MSPRRKRQYVEQEQVELDGGDSTSRGLQIQDKQREIWDAFREEHFEVIEQLPLNLHRQLSLMSQLDKQANDYASLLLPTLKRYIQKRKNLLLPQQSADSVTSGEVINGHERVHDYAASSSTDIYLGISLTKDLSLSKEDTSSVSAPTEIISSYSREILTQAVCLSDELLQACQEKANLAQAAHDTIERHIRLLDQAIQEQEAAISAGQQADGNLLPMLLPDLAVPRWSRTARVTLSPMSDEDSAIPFNNLEQDSLSTTDKEEHANANVKIRPKRKRRPDANGAPGDTRLMITIPAQPDAIIDPNEEVYCFCNRVSFGEMIACDSPNCRREWFHLGCVGLTENPKGKWFCDECRSAKKTRGNRI